jgi:DNA polymerase-1
VASNTGLSYAAASELITGFFAKASALKKWLDDQRAKAVKLGYSRSLKGRIRYYSLPTSQGEDETAHIERCGANNPIQSTCADVLKTALAKVYLAIRGGSWKREMIYDAHIILCVHDEIVLEVREDQTEDVKQLVKKCMEEAFTDIIKTVGIKVDVTIADYWKK